MKNRLALGFLCLLLTACSGSLSTIDEGFAYEMPRSQASTLVDSVIRANVASDRMLPGSELVASGYDRSPGLGVDTTTFTLSAIPVPSLDAFGFEVTHEGTRLTAGPAKAKRIYESAKQRASLLGPRVPLQ